MLKISKIGGKKMYKEIQNFTKVITTEFAEAVKDGKSYHLTTPSPSPDRGEGRENARQSGKNNCKYLIEGELKMLKIESNRKTAFTLMETLITVVILGILAAILVPNLIKNQVENANRTKVKKAMAAYEKAINMMIIENDIKSTEALRELGQDNCQYTREYFKTVKDGSNNCIFKTADRVWWNITDITNPILILKDSQLEKSETELKTLAKNVNDNTVFALVGRFDDLGTLRINDNAYEQSILGNLNNKKYMAKLWSFTTNTTIEVISEFAKCKASHSEKCIVNIDGVDVEYNLVQVTSAQCVNINNGTKSGKTSCVDESFYVHNFGKPSNYNTLAKDMTDSTCTSSGCEELGDYWNASKKYCENQGGHLASLGELKASGYGFNEGGYFWASDEDNDDYAYKIYWGVAYSNVKYGNKYYKVVCVGD